MAVIVRCAHFKRATPVRGHRTVASWYAEETIEPGQRVIYEVGRLDGVGMGITWQGIILPRVTDAKTGATRAEPVAGFQVALMETGVMKPKSRLHYTPIGWDAAAMEEDGGQAGMAELEDGDLPTWRQKFPDTGGGVGAADFQNFYTGKNKIFIVGTRSGSHQQSGAADKVPDGEAYLDAPLAAYMFCNPDHASANPVVVHMTAR